MQQYVEYTLARGDTPASMFRHAIARVVVAKRKKNQQVVTLCGESIGYDDAYIFAMPDSEVDGRKAFDRCHDCDREDGETAQPIEAAPTTIALSSKVVALRLEQLAVSDIDRSPLNHRTRFEGIEELGADIKANGLRVPIKVRPMPTTYATPRKQAWEIVYGERRWRAAKAAGVKTLPALIAELDDLAVIKEQLVENVSRSDVHPLEEADGYQLLLDKHGYDVERIATETGKSKATIYARLKLTALCPSARMEFFANKMNASIALLIARIPDLSLQEQATREVMGEIIERSIYNPDNPLAPQRRTVIVDEIAAEMDDYNEDGDPIENTAGPGRERLPMSVREAQLHLQRRYMLRLELAKFPINDASLVPSAGACTTCDHRTGNQRELFADVSSADVCTKPDCFADKAKAEGERRAREAEARGAKVVTGKAAEKVFEKEKRHDHPLKNTGKLTTEVSASSPYVDPTEGIGYNLAGGYNSKVSGNASWDKLLGKKLAKEVPTVVVVHPETGEARELLDKSKAIEVLRKAGKIPKPKKSKSSAGVGGYDPDKWERERQKRERDDKIRDSALAHLLVDVHAAALEQPSDETAAEHLAWWRWLISALLGELHVWQSNAAMLAMGEDEPVDLDRSPKNVDKLLASIKNGDQARALVTTMLIEALRPREFATGKGDEEFCDGLDQLGLGWNRYVEDAKNAAKAAEQQAEREAKEKEAKKPAAKKSPAKKKGRK